MVHLKNYTTENTKIQILQDKITKASCLQIKILNGKPDSVPDKAAEWMFLSTLWKVQETF